MKVRLWQKGSESAVARLKEDGGPGRHRQVTSEQLWMLQLMAAHIVVAEHNVQICTRHM